MNPVSPYAAMIEYVERTYPGTAYPDVVRRLENNPATHNDLVDIFNLFVSLKFKTVGLAVFRPLMGRVSAHPGSPLQAKVLGVLALYFSWRLTPEQVTGMYNLLNSDTDLKSTAQILRGLSFVAISEGGDRHASLLVALGILRKIVAMHRDGSESEYTIQVSILAVAVLIHASDETLTKALDAGIVKAVNLEFVELPLLLSFYSDKMVEGDREGLRAICNQLQNGTNKAILQRNLNIFTDFAWHGLIKRECLNTLRKMDKHEELSPIQLKWFWFQLILRLRFINNRIARVEDRIGLFDPRLIKDLLMSLRTLPLVIQDRYLITRILHQYAASPEGERKRYPNFDGQSDPVIQAFESQAVYNAFRNYDEAFKTTQLCMRISNDKRYHLPKHIIALIGAYNILQLGGNP